MHLTSNMHRGLWASLGIAVFAIAFVASLSAQGTATQPKARPRTPVRQGPVTWREFETWVAKELNIPCERTLASRGLEYADPQTLAEIMARNLPETAKRNICRDAAAALMPGAPDVARVEREAPALLTQLGQAVRGSNDAEIARLVHPALNRQRLHAVFASDGPQSLQKFAPTERFNRVAVQFYRLSGPVESLHQVQFALLDRGGQATLVVREIVPGEDLFLKEEQAVAISKLRNLFRALNSKDPGALKDLATPGLYESVKDVPTMGGGPLTETSVAMTPGVSTVDNATRPFVRVGYLMGTNRKKLEFDVDFERIDGDLRVVRLRDVQGKYIAFDPDIFNYTKRRFGIADGPKLPPDKVSWTEEPCFQSAALIQKFGSDALHANRSADLMELADCVADFIPAMAYALRASAQQMQGNHAGALENGRRAIEAGGTAYFLVTHHIEPIGLAVADKIYQPVVIAVSRERIRYLFLPGRPVGGRDELDIAIPQVVAAYFDRRNVALGGPRPFLTFKFRDAADRNREKTFNFAPTSAHCAGAGVTVPPLTRGAMWVDFPRTVCFGDVQGNSVGTRVPSTWRDELGTVMQLVQLVAPRAAQR